MTKANMLKLARKLSGKLKKLEKNMPRIINNNISGSLNLNENTETKTPASNINANSDMSVK